MAALAPVGISALIFGGCCTNVYALESILKQDPGSGLLITLMQFILVTIAAYPSQRGANGEFLRKPRIPLQKWAFGAIMFFSVNMLNNWAFAFDISVPIHIILRSFGSVSTMAAGWLTGKRYSKLQVFSVAVLTAGVVISAWADALSKGKSMDTSAIDLSDTRFELGLLILLVAQLLSAYMGIYVQDTYAKYGNHWDENLFYSHLFSLPLFLPLHGTLRSQYSRLQVSPPLQTPPAVEAILPSSLRQLLKYMPSSLIYLAMNSFTQLACITGVNLLGACSSAVTVTIVLNIRKLVSFMLSVWLFGNKLSGLMIVGATLVFGAGALYGWETTVRTKRRKTKSEAQSNGLAKKQ